jgi:hypothetical protein
MAHAPAHLCQRRRQATVRRGGSRIAAPRAAQECGARHHRHGNIRLLYRDEITAPEFGDWSMGFVDAAGVSRVLAGFADDGTAVPVLTSRRTRAKKVLALFQEGAYRQLVDR